MRRKSRPHTSAFGKAIALLLALGVLFAGQLPARATGPAADRSYVVVAVVDTGINPYHIDFRLPSDHPAATAHPCEYIEAFPCDADALQLTLDAESRGEALAADEAVWQRARQDRLYTVPGTKIIGAYSVSGGSDVGTVPVLDEDGHGTASASVAAGSVHGSTTDPEVLVVAVEGYGRNALEWAAQQPWIDVITNSWQYLLVVGGDTQEVSRAATESGKVVVFAAGNGASGTGWSCDRDVTYRSTAAGPSWVMSVGAVSPRNGQDYCWHTIPPDVSSYGRYWPAADHTSLDGEVEFAGTSNAAPLVAGVIAEQVLVARREFGDRVEGPHAGGVLASAGPAGRKFGEGPLADGRLTRPEVEEVTSKTAYPQNFDPEGCAADLGECAQTTPTTPAYFVYQGYGIVNSESKTSALAVLLGEAALPQRDDVDTWMTGRDAAADAMWGSRPS